MEPEKISALEQQESVDDTLLEEIGKALNIPVEAIKNFDTEQAIHNINNNFHDSSVQNQFHPLEKIIELYEVKIVSLYEKMLKTEREKNELLQKLLEPNK